MTIFQQSFVDTQCLHMHKSVREKFCEKFENSRINGVGL